MCLPFHSTLVWHQELKSLLNMAGIQHNNDQQLENIWLRPLKVISLVGNSQNCSEEFNIKIRKNVTWDTFGFMYYFPNVHCANAYLYPRGTFAVFCPKLAKKTYIMQLQLQKGILPGVAGSETLSYTNSVTSCYSPLQSAHCSRNSFIYLIQLADTQLYWNIPIHRNLFAWRADVSWTSLLW